MLKKRVGATLGIFLLVIFASFILAGQLWAAPITIKFATGLAPDEEEGLHRGAVVFKNIVEQKSGGRLKVDIYPSNQLGKEREQFEGVKLGTIEMCWIAEGPVAGFFPEIMVLGIPYLYSSEAAAYRSLDGPFGKALMEEMQEKDGHAVSLGMARTGSGTFQPETKHSRALRISSG